MNVKVGGGTMPLRALKDVTAAVYVLSSDDIKKSGANNIPDMLRLVPGVFVAQVDANKWMVSIRGFSSRYANKLQVLIDGRSVYSPSFSGVHWDQIGLTPDEIERIEVIRGSDGSLWGSNAVNGIINIVTKSSADTTGGYLQEGIATHTAGDHYARIGGKGKTGDTFRITARSSRVGQSETETYPSKDASEQNWVNFRSDHKLNHRDSLTVTSSLYSGKLGQSTAMPTLAEPNRVNDSRYPVSDFNLSSSMISRYSKKDVSELKLSYTRSIRLAPEYGLDLSTFDLGYNRSSKLSESSSVFYGGAFRQVNATTSDTPLITVNMPRYHPMTYSAYGQIEKDLGSTTQLTLGTSIEHNAYSGFEFQPSARILYRKDPTESLWFSLSRAVRTPSPADEVATFRFGFSQDPNSGLPIQVFGKGDGQFQSESVISVETGWRKQVSEKTLIDITGFYNSYNNLRSFEFSGTQVVIDAIPHIDATYLFRNGIRANTYGVETSVSSRMSDDWNLTANLSFIDDHSWIKPGVTGALPPQGTDSSGSVPKWQANILSSWILSDALKFGLSGHYVGAISAFSIPAHARLDAQVQWKLQNNWQVSLIGRDIFAPSTIEGTSTFFEIPMRSRRSLSLQFGHKF